MAQFLHGLDLNRLFFQQIIKPLMDEHFLGLRYSAGIVGEGSDVLGFDTPLSMDHNWGPHMRIFLSEEDYRNKRDQIDEMFRHKLPYEFMGFPTNFTKPNEKVYLVQQMKPISSGPVNHMIQFYTIKGFFEHYIGYDPYKRLTYKDWLIIPQQALIEVSRGELYYDGLDMQKMRDKFNYYPEKIWEYVYMIQWGKIADEQAFMGRTGEIGDGIGSRIIATNIVTHIMKLCFLMEKQYYPYLKWFGTAFSRLRAANDLTHVLLNIMHAKTWEEREDWLGQAFEFITKMHNDLRLTRPIRTEMTDYHGRPYKVIRADLVYEAIKASIQDKKLANMKFPLGSVDQFMSHPRLTHMNYVYREFKPLIT